MLLLDEVFAVGDENFQRKCFGVIAAFKSQGGTILFVSHDAQAVERLCERSILLAAGEKAFDGPTHEAIVRYRRLLADEVDPAERASGSREWGTGQAEITAARTLGGEWRGTGAVPRRGALPARGRPARARAVARRRDSTSRCATPPESSSPRRRSGRRRSAGPTAPAASP